VSGLPSGVTASAVSGSGNASVTLTADAASSARSGTITFATTAGTPGVSRTVVFSQAGTGDDCGASTGAFCTWSPLTTTRSGVIGSAGDKDWFKIVPTVSGVWTFTSAAAAASPLSDPVGTVYAADGTTVLASNDDINVATNRQFSVSVSLAANTTYYLQVAAWSTLTGGYVITASHS